MFCSCVLQVFVWVMRHVRFFLFTTKDTKRTKFGLSPEGFWPQGGVMIFRTLRVLRAFVVNTLSH